MSKRDICDKMHIHKKLHLNHLNYIEYEITNYIYPFSNKMKYISIHSINHPHDHVESIVIQNHTLKIQFQQFVED